MKGNVNEDLLHGMKAHPFFKLPFPKTTGPELFNLEFVNQAQITSFAQNITSIDLMATLTRFSAETIADAINKRVRKKAFKIFMSGGGAKNPLLVRTLKQLIPKAEFYLIDTLGIPADAKEAVLFAVLANETLAGGKINFGRGKKIPSITMGKISFPD